MLGLSVGWFDTPKDDESRFHVFPNRKSLSVRKITERKQMTFLLRFLRHKIVDPAAWITAGREVFDFDLNIKASKIATALYE